MSMKPSVRQGEELVQSPANPETQIDKDKIPDSEKSAEGFPLRKNKKQTLDEGNAEENE